MAIVQLIQSKLNNYHQKVCYALITLMFEVSQKSKLHDRPKILTLHMCLTPEQVGLNQVDEVEC